MQSKPRTSHKHTQEASIMRRAFLNGSIHLNFRHGLSCFIHHISDILQFLNKMSFVSSPSSSSSPSKTDPFFFLFNFILSKWWYWYLIWIECAGALLVTSFQTLHTIIILLNWLLNEICMSTSLSHDSCTRTDERTHTYNAKRSGKLSESIKQFEQQFHITRRILNKTELKNRTVEGNISMAGNHVTTWILLYRKQNNDAHTKLPSVLLDIIRWFIMLSKKFSKLLWCLFICK